MFVYQYDNTGRLLTVTQPTGETTALTTDISTAGFLINVATGRSMRQDSAMVTYGSVQSLLHGKFLACTLTYISHKISIIDFGENN